MSTDVSPSIFRDQIVPPTQTEEDRLSMFAMELDTVENLLVMGFASASTVNITARKQYLEREISHLEHIIARKRGGK